MSIFDHNHLIGFSLQGLMLLAFIGLGVVFLLRSKSKAGQRDRTLEKFGLEGEIMYADQGRKSRYFKSTKFGIIAKPDFLIKLKSGNTAVVEFKSRSNGRLYDSDVVQVKASVLAVRAQQPVQEAFVLVGTKLHAIPLAKSDQVLYKEIEVHAAHARKAKTGEIIHVYAKNPIQCKNCSHRSNCSKPQRT